MPQQDPKVTQDPKVASQPVKPMMSDSNPPDSTALLYYMRQESTDELGWLQSLLGKKDLPLNQFVIPAENWLASRRDQLIEDHTGKAPVRTEKIDKDTTVVQAISIIKDKDTFSVASDSLQQVSDTIPPQENIVAAATDSTQKSISDKFVDPVKKEQIVEEITTKKDELQKEVNSFISASDLMLMVLIVSFFVATWAKVKYSQFMRRMFLSIIAYSESYKVYRESNIMARQFYWALGFVFTTNFALFVYQNLEFFHVPSGGLSGLSLFSVIWISVVIVYTVKKLVLRTIGQLFMAYRMAEEYWFSISTTNRVLGACLFPFLLAIPYVPDFVQPYVIQSTWGIIGIAFMFRLVRGMRIAIEKHLSVFYMILYFCTLEILPVVLVAKYITDQVWGF